MSSLDSKKDRINGRELPSQSTCSVESTVSNGIQLHKHNKVSTFLLAQKPPKPIPKNRKPAPTPQSNIFAYLTFSWVGGLIHTGYTRVLELNDLWKQNDERKIDSYVAAFNKKRVEYKQKGSTSPYLKAIIYSVRWEFIIALTVFCLYITSEICLAVISRPTIAIITEVYLGDVGKRGHACGFAVGNFLENALYACLSVWFQYHSRYSSETLRSVLIACVYEKVVLLSPRGRSQFPANKITALVTTDTNRICLASRWAVGLIAALPIVGAMIGILVDNIGVSALPGAGIVVLGLFANAYLSKFIENYREKSIPYADKRIASVRDTVENMRIIKYYGWEQSFLEMISGERKDEAVLLEKIGRVSGLVDAFTTSVPLYAGLLSFALLSIWNGSLDPSRVFPSLTLFTIFIPVSMIFSEGMIAVGDAWPSLLRLEAFFSADEDAFYVEAPLKHTEYAVNIVDGTFMWESTIPVPAQLGLMARVKRFLLAPFKKIKKSKKPDQSEKPVAPSIRSEGSEKPSSFPGLVNVNLQIKKNELVMLVGSIGSGKSSLLSCIAGEMCHAGGHVYVDGKVTPVMANWSLNATIRENILFGSDYDAEKYSEVTHVCSLESDFSSFDGRDFAEIGERGITLSGGQKARLSLARGVYNAGDIILLDDVLSAVDAKVGKQIFDKCILGYLKNTTRVMATHNLKLLHMADKIIFFDGSGAVHSGSLDELLETNSRFRETYTSRTKPIQEDIEEVIEELDEEIEIPQTKEGYRLTKIPTIEPEQIQQQLSVPPPNIESLVSQESSRHGSLSGKIIYGYFRKGSRIGIYFIILILLTQAALAVGNVMEPVWLNFWASDKFHQPKGWYIGFYGLILTVRTVVYVLFIFAVASFCFTSSSAMHKDALENIYRAPMSYFDSTPLGRIISRFTDDVASLDTTLFIQLRMFLFTVTLLLGSLIVVFVYLPYAALALIPIVAGIWVFMSYFRYSSREIKRINAICRSTMFTHMTETISGLSTIVGYGRAQFFENVLHNSLDDLNVSMNVLVSSQMWLSFRIIMCTLPIGLMVSFLCVFRVFEINEATVGLLLSLIPDVIMSLSLGVPILTELENQMNSIERLHEFAHEIPQEAAFRIPETKPRDSWPENGHIVYKGASLRYRPNLPLALVDCNLNVPSGTKVGVVGRTGAGKSTMLSSLFRITELSEGSIYIDGVNISTIGLSDLRSRLSIIPQDPVLFQGTIRFNLDPFGRHTDMELWDTLKRCGAIQGSTQASTLTSPTHKFHLDARVDSAGTNFSLGERQLLTLGRALVRKPKIIVLDEATANVDLQTDTMIQETISREFADCTIMCIAHRLQTILHYDMLVVMDQGKILEQGSPLELWQRTDGAFRSMCNEANLTAEEIERNTKS